MGKSRKHRLSLATETDHVILAIASHEKGYHLAWNINKNLAMNLVRAADYHITKKQDALQSFPLFRWKDETRMTSYHLVANRSESGTLVDKLKNIDFFFHISPKPEDDFVNNLLDRLNNMPVIITSFIIDPAGHPFLKNMIFE